MSAIPLMFVDTNQEWLEFVHEVLGEQYDVRTAKDLAEIGEPYPGGLFSLIFVVWRHPERQRKQIEAMSQTEAGRKRVVVVLPRREESSEELRSIFLAGAYDFVDKPQSPRALQMMVSRALQRRYGGEDKEIAKVNPEIPNHITALQPAWLRNGAQ